MSQNLGGGEGSGSFQYTAITGYFKHDEQPVGPSHRAITLAGLGLIDRAYDTDLQFDPGREKNPWQRFEYYVHHLNQIDPKNVRHKVIYVTRHGLGFHNAMEATVGRQQWKSYWARLDGNDATTWADTRLTIDGIRQAQSLCTFWQDALSTLKVPAPEKYYTSPLARCLETTKITFSGLDLPQDRPFKPVVKELLRERHGVHTCDRRSTRSWIQSAYPDYETEASFTEEDRIWHPQVRESVAEHVARTTKLLEDIFTDSNAAFISFTVHSGTIRALYEAIGHRETWVAAGAVIPMLVRAERVNNTQKGHAARS